MENSSNHDLVIVALLSIDILLNADEKGELVGREHIEHNILE